MSKELLWQADRGDGTYRNPILYADYSDPDVIRVGQTYYMTASSFNYTPGLPILTSSDLVNWHLVNYAVKNLPDDRFRVPAHSQGVWAPAIRYHDGRFWIFYGMPDEGIYMVHSEDPLGDWSDPYLILPGKGYIDPCPFWDDDGRAYIIHGYAKSRIGFKSIIGLFEITPDGTQVIEEDHFIYDGTGSQATIEGPKVYKRNGWYYIFAPAGGVTKGWQTVLRSRNIEGPYEERIVMAQRDTKINGPHQGGLVDTMTGDNWFIHFQDKGVYGRITHLQPVEWCDNDWPIIGVDPDENGCGKPQITGLKPSGVKASIPSYLQASDSFSSTSLGLQWQWMGNHEDSFYKVEKDTMRLRLNSLNTSGSEHPILWHCTNVLTQKVVCPAFEVETKVYVDALGYNQQTGIVLMGGEYAYMAVRKDSLGLSLVYVESATDGGIKREKVHHRHALDLLTQSIILRQTFAKEDSLVSVTMAWSEEGEIFETSGHSFIPSSQQWTGSKVGIFCLSMDKKGKPGYSEFDYFKVTGME